VEPDLPMNKLGSQPVLLGGLIIGVLSALPVISIANCCCLWIAGGGAVAAYLAQQQSADPFSVGDGALTGALAGLVGAGVWLLVWTPIHLILTPLQAKLFSEMMSQVGDIPQPMRMWAEGMRFGAFTLIQVTIGFLVMLVIGTLFAAIGGMLGIAIFGRRQPPAQTHQPPAQG
jgi:hypothetical protein